MIEASKEQGFNYPYLIFLPENLSKTDSLFLIIEPNNSGFAHDDLAEHVKKARRTASNEYYIGNYISRQLKIPLIVPVFPRPESQWQIYTHALDRDAMLQVNNDLERLDLQLLGMADHARSLLGQKGYHLKEKFLLTGFSASGTFANRFALIHPDKIKAVAAGGVNGLLALPISELDSQQLEYPLGISDFKNLFEETFNETSFRELPQYYFMGENDDNDAIPYADGYNDQEREIVFDLLSEQMMPDRWEKCREHYQKQQIHAIIKTYLNIGHEHPESVKEDISEFFRTSIE